jgi:hypothetical protein
VVVEESALSVSDLDSSSHRRSESAYLRKS